jgi:hypothetical protein
MGTAVDPLIAEIRRPQRENHGDYEERSTTVQVAETNTAYTKPPVRTGPGHNHHGKFGSTIRFCEHMRIEIDAMRMRDKSGWDRLCSAAQNFRKRSRVSVPHRSVNDVEPKAFYVLHEALIYGENGVV